MPAASEDAFLGPSAEHVPGLAALYDSFAHAIDPFAPERDRAEQAFELEVASWYDSTRLTDQNRAFTNSEREY